MNLGERTAQASLKMFGADAAYNPHSGDTVAVRVILDRDVTPTQQGQQSSTVERRTELTAHHDVLGDAKRRESITLDGDVWLLDRKDRDDGYLVTWFVIPAPPEP